MAPHKRRNLVATRRRIEDEGEEEEGSLAGEVDDDSLSEGSVSSNPDEDADGEGSVSEDDETTSPELPAKLNGHTNGHPLIISSSQPQKSVIEEKGNFGTMAKDTDVMLNGLKVEDPESMATIEFNQTTSDMDQATLDAKAPSPAADLSRTESIAERRKRDHEEYKKKRDTDPAFVPNRGGFFMHDSRSSDAGTNGFRPPIRGKGRARGSFLGALPVR